MYNRKTNNLKLPNWVALLIFAYRCFSILASCVGVTTVSACNRNEEDIATTQHTNNI